MDAHRMPTALSELDKAKLHWLVQEKKLPCDDIVKLLPKALRSGAALNAVRNRYHTLIRFHKEKPAHYWKLYSDSLRVIKESGEEPWTPVAIAVPVDNPETRRDTPDQDSPSNIKSSWTAVDIDIDTPQKATRSRSSARSSSLKMSTPDTEAQAAAAAAAAAAEVAARTPPRKPSRSPARNTKKKSKSKNLFKTLEEAVSMVDDTVALDPDFPETVGHNLLVNRFDDSIEISGQNGGITNADKLRVTMTVLADLRDFKCHTLKVVLNGTALWYKYPVVSAAFLEDFESMMRGDKATVVEKFSHFANAVQKDPIRRYRTVLFLMPEGVTVTIDKQSIDPSEPKRDQLVRVVLGEVVLTSELKDPAGTTQVTQKFFPGFYDLRIIGNPEDKTRKAEAEEDWGLTAALKGRKAATKTKTK